MHICDDKMGNNEHLENAKLMLDDDEALEGVEAWLHGQGLTIKLSVRYPGASC